MFNTHDIRGGAARAAYRLHQGMRKADVDSRYIVAHKESDDPHTFAPTSKKSRTLPFIRSSLDKLPLRLYPRKGKSVYSLNYLPTRKHSTVISSNPDIVHLHWIGEGFFGIEDIGKIKKPVVWTLHDMWAFTGGCHYAGTCTHYQNRCGSCPQLHSRQKTDLTTWIFERKKKAWKNIDLTIVTPSRWLGECARKSFLFRDRRVEVIPNGINPEQFKPHDQAWARSSLNLPLHKRIILFGAMYADSDRRKGMPELLTALAALRPDEIDQTAIVIFGASGPQHPCPLKMPCHFMGTLHDNISLSLLYAAADVVISPSGEENLSNVVMESLSCGTPVVAFNIGGMPDMIEHMQNGYLARPCEAADLAEGIRWVLENEDRRRKLRENARTSVLNKYSIDLVVQQYIDLYKTVLGK